MAEVSEYKIENLENLIKGHVEKLAPVDDSFFPSLKEAVAIVGTALIGFGGVALTIGSGGIAGPAAAGIGAATGAAIWDWASEQEDLAQPEHYEKSAGVSSHLTMFFYFLMKSYSGSVKQILDEAKTKGEDPHGLYEVIKYHAGIVSNYLTDRTTKVSFSLIPEDLYEGFMTEDLIRESKFVASVVLNIYSNDKSKIGNEALKALITVSIEKMREGSFKSHFGIDSSELTTTLNLFSFNKAAKALSKGVQDQIKGGANEEGKTDKNIQIQVNPAEGGSKNFALYRQHDLWKVSPHKLLPDSKGVPVSSLTDPDMIEKFNLRSDTVQWPLGVYKEDVPGSKEALEALRKFDEINEDKDITSYAFKYFTQVEKDVLDEVGFVGGLLSSFIEWVGDNPDQTTEELIFKQVAQEYLEYISQILRISVKEEEIVSGETIRLIAEKRFEKNTNLIRRIYGYIAVDKEISRRVELFKELERIEAERADDEKGKPFTDEELKRAQLAGLDGFIKTDIEDAKVDALSEEAIKNMQKFYKQCALMMNIGDLQIDQEAMIKENYSKLPYDGRFYVVRSQDSQETILTKLISSEHTQKLFELEPWQMSSMVPKLRIFKVMEDLDGKKREVEFIFERTSKINRSAGTEPDGTIVKPTNFMSSEIDKGSGVGVKEFSIDFSGTNPAEARNDIKATLKLFFQSFTDFIRYRGSSKEDSYRYADLVIQPTPNKQNKAFGIPVRNNRQYEPSFYRIRVDMGYYVPDFADQNLRDAIAATNKSFMLTMVDHDINFNKDGTVEISIEYRAYLETLLKHPKLDALASPELIKLREQNALKLAEEISKKNCSKEQLRELQISLASKEEEIAQKSLKSIMQRLEDRGVIYNALVNDEHRTFFLNNGFFRECDLISFVASEGVDGDSDLGRVLSQDLPEESEDFDFLDSKDRLIQYFYFGDLLYTILDCIYEDGNKPRPGMGNNKIVLGSFDFESFAETSRSDGNVYGIDQLPISVDFFSRWFTDNVTTQKDTRKTFPVLNFIRQLSNSLMRETVTENCVNRKPEKKLRFQTGQVTAINKDGEPLEKIAKASFAKGKPIINLDEWRKAEKLPLVGSQDEKTDLNHFYNYIVLSAIGSTLTYTGWGIYGDDIKDGRYHVQVGQKTGMVKSISLSKTNQTYLREARFFQNGIDGLLQLSNVYMAKLEMFGNTVFYPGMEFYFNPYGLGGGTEFGAPNDPDQSSVAWKMGIGGYHTVTNVKTTLTPGKFTTTVTGQQYYAGDGSGNSDLQKRRAPKSIEDYTPSWGDDKEAGKASINACNDIISRVQFEDAYAAGTVRYPESPTEEPPADSVEAPTPEAPPEEPDGTVEEDLTEEAAYPSSGPDGTTSSDAYPSTGVEEDVVIGDEPASYPEGATERTWSGTIVSTTTTSGDTSSRMVETTITGNFREDSYGNIFFTPNVGENKGVEVELPPTYRIE